jgi:tetratricopeptide (TPR) repeat protein
MYDVSFPPYVRREAEEDQILAEVERVRAGPGSRVVLLYGQGGIGKTQLVRALSDGSHNDEFTVWLDPVDVDDSEYWLLSNLERKVARQLDPRNEFFQPYFDYLSRLPDYSRPQISHEAVVSHLGRIKRVFTECYTDYVRARQRVVVMTFDTVETIRGMYLLLTLTQWMKALPATLFILSGRPPPGTGGEHDPIREELEDPHQRLPVETVMLGQFTEQAARRYIESSGVAAGLRTEQEKSALVRLTRGHPLWLAFAVSYCAERGFPDEAKAPLAEIEAELPYRGELSPDGQRRHEDFKGRLVTPYREADFWHESIKRLAVVRQSVSQPIFERLMSDYRQLPEGVESPAQAWKQLQAQPWIRTRSNERYVTLHDAVAEELALRIIPLHDQGKEWREDLWSRAVDIYAELTEGPEAEVIERLRHLDRQLEGMEQHLGDDDEAPAQPASHGAFIDAVVAADTQKRELDQLRAVRLHYRLLCDFAEGCRQFIAVFDQAARRHEVLFQDRLALEIQRFLPGGVPSYAFGDVIGEVIERFRRWIANDGREYYLEIGLRFASYLIENEQTKTVVEMLDRLPAYIASHAQRYELNILRGNAYMRTEGRVREGLEHFSQALREARELDPEHRQDRIANAYKELGFYYRNAGLWREADDAYRSARDAVLVSLTERESDQDSEQMASIQTQWAYIKGLAGSYRDAQNLVESAITARQRLGKKQAEGFSWSVRGEVYRYERRFETAWESYETASQIFQGLRNWTWLGLVYQEQAICLVQAAEDGISLLDPDLDAMDTAKRQANLALDLCKDGAVRGYPSALNRAGRIFGQENPDLGLKYLEQGIEQAEKLSDGWFWFANLIEYAEMSYRTWVATGEQRYRDGVDKYAENISHVMQVYAFPDLRGRWLLLRGHLGIREWMETRNEAVLSTALDSYVNGFGQLADSYVGSSGAAAVPGEFKVFGQLFRNLPEAVQLEWRRTFRNAWSQLADGSTLLLARLEELY